MQEQLQLLHLFLHIALISPERAFSYKPLGSRFSHSSTLHSVYTSMNSPSSRMSRTSPYREDRDEVRDILEDGEFIEVYTECSVEECEKRDPKGTSSRSSLYGEINAVIAIVPASTSNLLTSPIRRKVNIHID
jgi:hypothetical protein